MHDRQSRFDDELPLPPSPLIQPGMLFEDNVPYIAPCREIDSRAGYYVNGEWCFAQQLLIRAMHYDNRADPTADEDGQYAWTTKFEVTQNDQTPQVDNAEHGDVWTFAYLYDFSDKVSFGAESLSLKTDRFGWTYYGPDPTREATSAKLATSLRELTLLRSAPSYAHQYRNV